MKQLTVERSSLYGCRYVDMTGEGTRGEVVVETDRPRVQDRVPWALKKGTHGWHTYSSLSAILGGHKQRRGEIVDGEHGVGSAAGAPAL